MFSWPQDFATNFQFLLRWIHFLGGITWIGMLYFFNLVNVQFQKEIDARDQGQGQSPCCCRRPSGGSAGAPMFTWFSGFIYYGLLVTASEQTGHMPLRCIFLVGWSIAFVVICGPLPRRGRRRPAEGRPRPRGLVIAIVVIFIGYATALDGAQLGASQPHDLDHGRRRPRHDHVLERLDDHLAAAEEDHRRDQGDRRERRRRRRPIRPKWARRAFLASRTNAWLSIPMLFFMGAASHFPIFSTLEKIAAP